MTVKSVDMKDGQVVEKRRRNETAMFSGAAIDRGAISGMRLGALLILIASFVGSIAALNGGWAPVVAAWPFFWRGIDPLAALFGIILQLLLTWTQWHKRKEKISIGYIFTLIIDVALTFIGYQTILVPLFTRGILRVSELSAGVAGGLAVAVALAIAVAVAMLPEGVLVD